MQRVNLLSIPARIICWLLVMGIAFQTMAANPDSLRTRTLINTDWRFQKDDPAGLGDQLSYAKVKPWLLAGANAFTHTPLLAPKDALTTSAAFAQPGFDDSGWRKLNLPHDWGIEGPFKQEYPGDTGKLAWWGVGWYRKTLDVSELDRGRRLYLDLDGAMSYATVWCNGKFAGGWPYGYSSFRVDLTPFINFGAPNTIAIRLDNPPESSRWYPGGGIYRNVWLVKTSPVHVGQWGTKITTPEVSAETAIVKVETQIANVGESDSDIEVETQLFQRVTKQGIETREPAAESERAKLTVPAGKAETITQSIVVKKPRLWNLTMPNLYVAVTKLTQNGQLLDEYETPFGIRKIEFTADRGFLLNGQRVPLNGVCNHHDLGALGAAFNIRAAERQLEIMKEMGVNALRVTHNPPAPELLDLCDRMGILVMDESFDCWIWGKTPNDYARLFPDWSERDLRALIRRDRNHPSVIMWSVGNEIVNIEAPENAEIAKRLVGIVHEEDTTRPATAAVNNTPVAYNGFQTIYDVFGFNYRSMEYERFHKKNPTIPVYGSETASTVSSRGEYFFPVADKKSEGRSNFQVSSYDLYAPPWAWPPDAEFKWLDEAPATLGEFVWTGIDYLGEPTPYGDDWSNLLNIPDPVQREKLKNDLEAMAKLKAPSRSSYFGIVDLAGFKKDRFYLYQSRWRPDLPMAHILPHWTWPGREGQVTPVHVYSSGDEAELFLNGKSLGKKKRDPLEYRFRWDDVKYEPGELLVEVTKNGKRWAKDSVKTAGAATRMDAEADRTKLSADGQDLAFITVSITDPNGTRAPRAENLVKFEISGPGEIVAVDNGDATSHEPFQAQQHKAFNGLALAIIRTKAGEAGGITVRALSDGLKSAEVRLNSAVGEQGANLPVVLDPAKTQGTWDGWGISLCWWAKVYGNRDDVADLLFTTNIVDFEGYKLPGLGMNIVRYNAGACSWNEVGDRKMVVSKSILPFRQIESYWLDGKSDDPQSKSWDWKVDANQRAMLQKARERGANYFELFSNSPPWWMCKNDNPSGQAEKGKENLAPENFQKFAIYLATLARYAKDHWGITFTTVEPLNEPSLKVWTADFRQEGCYLEPDSQAAILQHLRAELNNCGLKDMPIAASDENQYSHAVATWEKFDAATRALVGQFNVHGYQYEKGPRAQVYKLAKSEGKRLWNSEYGDNNGTGLKLANNIHLDMRELHPTAWCYWQLFDGKGWGLVQTEVPPTKILGVNPKYFVLAQYTRHIRPGMEILDTGDPDIISAYDVKTRKLVIVAVNPGDQARDKVCDLARFGVTTSAASCWRTEPKGDSRYQKQLDVSVAKSQLALNLPPFSVQTFEIGSAP